MVNYPASLDTLTNPTSTTKMNDTGFFGDVVISNLNDIAEALEVVAGANAAATDHLDYVRMHDGTNKSLWVPVSSHLGLNPIQNAAFDIWQDGATFTGIADNTWGPDGWLYRKSSAGVHDLLRSTDVPTVAQAQRVNYSLHLDVTTADTSIASTDFCTIDTRIEGYAFKPLDQKAFSLRFWVKGSKTGPHYVFAKNSLSDRSCVISYSITAADTWEEKQVYFPANPSAGTWDYATGRGLEIGWTLAAGSSFQTTAGSWVAGNFFCAADQVNELDAASNNFRIALIGRPTLGTNALPFQSPDYQAELLRCQRYNEVFGGTGSADPMGTGGWYAATTAWSVVDLVPKRAAPSFTVSAASDFQHLTAAGGVVAATAGPSTFLTATLMRLSLTTTCSGATATAGQATALHAANTNARLKVVSRIP